MEDDPLPIKAVVSPEVIANLPFGKYTRWCTGELPVDALVLLLWAMGAFGREYHAAQTARGFRPTPVYRDLDRVAASRTTGAITTFVAVWSGKELPEPQAGGGDWPLFDPTKPAFTADFRDRLRTGYPDERWAADLSERQLWVLLWEVGEYGIRIFSTWGEKDDGHPPAFGVGPPWEPRMRSALVLISMIHSGRIPMASAARNLVESGVV